MLSTIDRCWHQFQKTYFRGPETSPKQSLEVLAESLSILLGWIVSQLSLRQIRTSCRHLPTSKARSLSAKYLILTT